MTIDTQHLDADGDKIKLARPALLDMAQRINNLLMFSVTSIANLRLIDKTKATRAIVLGYYSPGDGGGGEYYLDAADTTSADNGGTVVVSVDGGRWKLAHQGAVSVKQFGAKGDGTTDDAPSFQAAITYVVKRKNAALLMPGARYKIDSGLTIIPDPLDAGQNHLKVSIIGDGRSTQLLHYGTGPLFQGTGLIHGLTFRDFAVINKRSSDVVTDAVFYFPDGNSDSDYLNLFHGVDPGETTFGTSFYVCGVDKFNDGVNFDNCYAYIRKLGYRIGKGSSVFIDNGRIIGQYPTIADGIGLHLTGGNGGVWVTGTDFISSGIGIKITADSGTTNREIFLISSAVDSCNVGLGIYDHSYVSFTGCWAASCDSSNIDFNPPSDNPTSLLNISGGTIFNAGALGTVPAGNRYGLSVNQFGRFEVTGVTFRNNKARGLSCNSGSRTVMGVVSQCRFYQNGDTGISGSTQAQLAGSVTFKDNVLESGSGSYAVSNVSLDAPSQASMRISNNDGYRGVGLRTTLTVPTSNTDTTNTSGQDVTAYIRQGTVQSVWVSGNPVYDYGAGTAANCAIDIAANAVFKIVYSVSPNIAWNYK